MLLEVKAWAIFVSTRDACVARDWNSSRGQGSADGFERFTGRSSGDMAGLVASGCRRPLGAGVVVSLDRREGLQSG